MTLATNHATIEEIVQAPYANWGPDDAYSLYRFLTHALPSRSRAYLPLGDARHPRRH